MDVNEDKLIKIRNDADQDFITKEALRILREKGKLPKKKKEEKQHAGNN